MAEKTMLIDAIIGRGFQGYEGAKYEKLGLAQFTGNQHNQSWAWLRPALDGLGGHELLKIYNRPKTLLERKGNSHDQRNARPGNTRQHPRLSHHVHWGGEV